MIEISQVDLCNAEKIAYRKALRKAIQAVESLPQTNTGRIDLIRRDKAVSAIEKLAGGNSLVWGGIHIEDGEEPK